MTKWVYKGLQTGIKTTRYPGNVETAPGVSPGKPAKIQVGEQKYFQSMIAACPTGAIGEKDDEIAVDNRRCIHCYRCKRQDKWRLHWDQDFEWAELSRRGSCLDRSFSHSLNIRITDAGACGACLSEIRQISSPYYNIHRLGFFITPTPRSADILMVAGPLTDHMRIPLKETVAAMPTPMRIIAVGTCALTGGIFGPSFAADAGVSESIPVAIAVPGCPPPPLAIIHALLMAAGKLEKYAKEGRG